jgi:hypothetical protein
MVLRQLAAILQCSIGMMPSPSGGLLASRFLEPLSTPWAVVAAGVAGGGAVGWNAVSEWLQLGWRLLHLLLSF